MSGLTRALFRAMMTTVRDLKRRPLRVRLPVEQSRMQWMIPGAPQGALTDPIIESTAAHIAELFPSIASVNEDGQHWPLDAEEITPSQLRSAIRAEFRRGPSLPSSVSSSSTAASSTAASSTAAAPPPPLFDMDSMTEAFDVLKALIAQERIARTSSAHTTEPEGMDGVRVGVEATSAYLGRQSKTSWIFQYRIRITNLGAKTVQLVGRGWDIRNADGSLHAAVPRNSPGIVGQTPVLQTGQSFE